jgi:hypothetical protein
MTKIEAVRVEEDIEIGGISWHVLTYNRTVLAVSPVLGENPGAITLPYEISRTWGDATIGRWIAPGEYGAYILGFVRPTSHRDIGQMWPDAYKLPIQITLEYDR